MKSILSNKPPYLLALLWVIVQYLVFTKNGIVSNLEAEKYILKANSLIENGSYSLTYISYSTYIFFLAIIFKLGAGYKGVIIGQLLLNGIATIKFFQLTKTISGKRFIAYVATFFFISAYQIQVWNFHLYTDAFFLSLLIIFFDALINSKLNEWSNRIKLVVLFVLLFFSRPVGILFLPPIVAYFIVKNKTNIFKSKAIIYSSISLVLLFITLIYLNRSQLIYNGLFQGFPSNQILCGFDSGLADFISLADNNQGTLSVIYHNIALFTKVSLIKLTRYYGLIRPFFSTSHNLILMTFYPVYLFAIVGLSSKFKQKEYKYLLSLSLALFSLLVVLTCVNWHGRFILPILPFIIILGAIGFDKTIQRVLKK